MMRGQWTPLLDLVSLQGTRFEGRHYDQTATWMRYMMNARGPEMRQRVLATARRLLRGAHGGSLSAMLGESPAMHERSWLAATRTALSRRRRPSATPSGTASGSER